MATQLIESMSGVWKPGDFRDEFRERLSKVIQKRMKSKGLVQSVDDAEDRTPEGAATNVVDFMSLLEQSLATKKRTPAKKAVSEVVTDTKAPKPAKAAKTTKTAAKRAAPSKKKARKAG